MNTEKINDMDYISGGRMTVADTEAVSCYIRKKKELIGKDSRKVAHAPMNKGADYFNDK